MGDMGVANTSQSPRFRPIEDLIKDPLFIVFRNWAPLLVAYAILYAVSILIVIITMVAIFGPAFIRLILNGPGQAPFTLPSYFGVLALGLIVLFMLVYAWFFSVTVATVGFKGGRAPIGGSMKMGLKRLLPLFLMQVVVLVSLWSAAWLLIFPAVILGTGLCLAPYLLVLEDTGVFQALGTSWQVTKGLRWPIFGRLLLLCLVIFGVASLLAFVSSFGMFIPTTSFILLPVMMAFQLIIIPYALAYIYCIYEDVRAVRKEVCGLSGGLATALIVFSILTIISIGGAAWWAFRLLHPIANTMGASPM